MKHPLFTAPTSRWAAFSRPLTVLFALAAATWAMPASALNLDLSDAGNFNLLTWGNASLQNSDTEGTVAVGGNATFNAYSVGNSANNPSPSSASLVVKGNLNAGNGNVKNGSIYVGGTYSGPGYSLNTTAGSVTQSGMGSAVPFNFAGAQSSLTAKSAAYGAASATGTSTLLYSTLTLTGSGSGVNVFNITPATLAAASTLVINVTPGTQVLINVSGTTVNLANKGISGATAGNTLFNFYEAVSLTISGIDVTGSVLAPLAATDFISGQINGQLITSTFEGYGEMHNQLFTSKTSIPPSVPDAASTALLLVSSLGALALVRQRFSAVAQ